MKEIQELIKRVEVEINKTPTGELRNLLCDANIVLHQQALHTADVKQSIIAYTNWLSKQNLMICEGADGHTFRSSMIGGKKYTAEELYNKFVSEYVA